jgi:hypothetical protein
MERRRHPASKTSEIGSERILDFLGTAPEVEASAPKPAARLAAIMDAFERKRRCSRRSSATAGR